LDDGRNTQSLEEITGISAPKMKVPHGSRWRRRMLKKHGIFYTQTAEAPLAACACQI